MKNKKIILIVGLVVLVSFFVSAQTSTSPVQGSEECSEICPMPAAPYCPNRKLIDQGNDECGCYLGATCCGNDKCEGNEASENCPEDCETSSCKENIPSFSISPLIQEGEPGDTLVYNLNIKNNDVNCAPRWFSSWHSMPLVPPIGWTMQDCYKKIGPCLWDSFFCLYGADNYPDCWRGSPKLESQEKVIIKANITSKDNWPNGKYFHYINFCYTPIGEENNLHFNCSIRKSFTYKISSGIEFCPVGCICKGEVITCPMETTYPKGCIYEEETMTCSIETTETCPIGCICKGETTTCPTEQEPIETEITWGEGITPSEGKTGKVTIGKTSSGKIYIKEGVIEVITSEKVRVIESQMFMETSVGNKEIKIMPETASERAIQRLGELNFTIELKEVGKGDEAKPVYEMTGEKQGRFLGIFKIMARVQAQVDAETGELISTKKPWWSFLAVGI